MGYQINKQSIQSLFNKLSGEYVIYAPKVFVGDGRFSDTDTIRYGEIMDIDEIVFDQKSDYSWKEVLLPINETLFYFIEDETKVPDMPKKGAIVFLRSCDLHALVRMDDIYLRNGFEDFNYKRMRERTKFILMGCTESFESCFCISMGTNQNQSYDAYIKLNGEHIFIDCKWDELDKLIQEADFLTSDVSPDFVTENKVAVNIPENITNDIFEDKLWEDYTIRCIACGRCNFVCPTCTCFTMQDIFYKDNDKSGERRRVWASCQVDGFTEMAGGHSFRQANGQRMRFKTMHKINDYKKRWGYHMCVGCGRCDEVCPEYISFSNCINIVDKKCKSNESMKEVE